MLGQSHSFSKVIGCFSAGKVMLTAGYFPRLSAIIYIPECNKVEVGLSVGKKTKKTPRLQATVDCVLERCTMSDIFFYLIGHSALALTINT